MCVYNHEDGTMIPKCVALVNCLVSMCTRSVSFDIQARARDMRISSSLECINIETCGCVKVLSVADLPAPLVEENEAGGTTRTFCLLSRSRSGEVNSTWLYFRPRLQ